MSDSRLIERQILTERVLDATTIGEILAARSALRAWIKANPSERELLRDAFEQLAQMEDAFETQALTLAS